MANLKDLLVTGVARFLGTVQAKLFKGDLEGIATSAKNADTVDGFHGNDFIKGCADSQSCSNIDTCVTGGTYYANATDTTNFPSTYGTYGILDVRVYGSTVMQYLSFTDTNSVYTRSKIVGQTEWCSFIKLVKGDETITGSYLPLSGGTLTGILNTTASINISNACYLQTRHIDGDHTSYSGDLFLNYNTKGSPIRAYGPLNIVEYGSNVGQLRIRQGDNFDVIFRNDRSNFYMLVSETAGGGYTTARPLIITKAGVCNINGNADTVDGIHMAATADAPATAWLAAWTSTSSVHAIAPASASVGYATNSGHANALRHQSLCYDIFSTSLTNTHACWNKWCYVVGNSTTASSTDYIANAPESSSALWYEVITGGVDSGSRGFQIAIGCFSHQRSMFIRFKHDATWSGWKKITLA